MQDYGNFLPIALLKSTDKSLHQLGERLDLFTLTDTSYFTIGFNLTMQNTHVLVETYNYLTNLLSQSADRNSMYIMKEQVSASICA